MASASTRQREIAAEQRFVDQVYARLDVMRASAAALEREGYQRGRLRHQASLVERDAMVYQAAKRLHALDAEYEGLVFGRLDLTDGQLRHIGRLGVRDADYETMLVDWRAPAAEAFYRATPEAPMEVVRRRVIRCSGPRVRDVDDDVLVPDALPGDMSVVGEGALLTSLNEARGPAMRDIVATIQKEQDEAIRAPAGGVTEITGGPGTGKTAVALHRAAYLLYTDRGRYAGSGVLVVGPSALFMNYISRVLPSLGEDTVDMRSVGELLDGTAATRHDPPDVTAVKGSLRMRQVLRRALRDAPPGAPDQLRIVYAGEVLKLDAAELAKVRQSVHRGGRLPNSARPVAREALLEALWDKAQRYADGAFRPRKGPLVEDIGDRGEFHRFAATWWPWLTPEAVLGALADPQRLARVARGILSNAEVAAVATSYAGAGPDGNGWSVADVALLDELRVMLGEPPKPRVRVEEPELWDAASGSWQRELTTWSDRVARKPYERPTHYDEYAHIIIDEAQDLSPMQWRMLGRRGRHASWTIVGDPAQRSWPAPDEAEKAKRDALGRQRHHRAFLLRTNYRNTTEIFALAARLVVGVVPDDQLPIAVRSSGVEPVFVTAPPHRWAPAVRAAVRDLLSTVDGTVGVISATARRDEMAGWLAADQIADGRVTDPRVEVVGSLDAKGLEYDAVVLVEPAELIAESTTGPRGLYVALSRATQRLTVVASDQSWLPPPSVTAGTPSPRGG